MGSFFQKLLQMCLKRRPKVKQYPNLVTLVDVDDGCGENRELSERYLRPERTMERRSNRANNKLVLGNKKCLALMKERLYQLPPQCDQMLE